MRIRTLTTTALLSLLPLFAAGAGNAPLDAFPDAQAGATRFVIHLPEMARSEEHYALEIVAGRVIRTDGVNRARMDTVIDPRPLEGWGFTYYVVTGTGQVASTLMAPPPGIEPVEAFVHGTPLRLPYNSRMPVVIYAPEGFELRYRIWAAADAFLPVGEG